MNYLNTIDFAIYADKEDELAGFRNRFHIPLHNGKEVCYFTGNSLGLQPKTVRAAIEQELDDWAKYAVEGHFKAKNPWFSYNERFHESLSKLVGALPSEV